MNRIDRALQQGSLFRVILFSLSIVVLASYIVTGVENRGGAFVILLVGVAGTAREYLLFRRRRNTEER